MGRSATVSARMLRLSQSIIPRSDANLSQILVKSWNLAGRDDRTDVAVRADQHQVSGRDAVSVAHTAAIIDDIAARADGMADEAPGERRRVRNVSMSRERRIKSVAGSGLVAGQR